jgi:general secretion pathway protein L
METLFIQPERDGHSARWLVLDDSGQPHAGMRHGALEQVKDFTRQRRVVCALDSTEILLERARLPASRNRRKLQQAVPFALEDELAEDVDALHFALGKERTVEAGGEDEAPSIKQVDVPVAVIGKNTLESWLDTLHQAGIKPHAVVPDVLSLPLNDNEWTVLLTADAALVRTGPDTGYCCEPENLAMILDSALDSDPQPPEAIRVWQHGEVDTDLQLRHDNIELTVTESDQPPLATLARGYGKQPSINLLQGEYSYRQEYGKLLKPWQLPAALLAALVLMVLTGYTIEYTQLKRQNEELTSQIEQVYKEVFPNSRNPTAPRRQLETKLAELGAGSEVDSPLLEVLNTAAVEIAKRNEIDILSINFNGRRLELDIAAGDVQQIDQLKQKMVDKGLDTEIQSASAEGEQVRGQLRITAG